MQQSEGNPVVFFYHKLLVTAAAAKLQEKGVSVEVIDPRTLVLLDKQAIIDSVKKTGKLSLWTRRPRTGGTVVEIAVVIGEEIFDHLDAPVQRVCAPDTPVSSAPALERIWTPDEDKLIKAITEISSA